MRLYQIGNIYSNILLRTFEKKKKKSVFQVSVGNWFRRTAGGHNLPKINHTNDSRRNRYGEEISESRKMVAISLYRGNLHRVPDGPRRWLMPTPKISLKDFKTLLTRRNRALLRLRGSIAITVNPNPISTSIPKQPQLPPPQDHQITEAPSTSEPSSLHQGPLESKKTDDGREEEERDTKGGDQNKSEADCCLVKPVTEPEVALEKAVDTVDGDGKLHSPEVEEKPAVPANVNTQVLRKLK